MSGPSSRVKCFSTREREPLQVDRHARPARDPVSPLTPAFRELFETHFAYVWASLRRLGVADRDREDQANEVFFRVHQRLDDYDPGRPVRPWLFAFAVRVAAEYRRLARNRYEVVGDVEHLPPPEDTSSEAELLRREKRDLVVAALGELDLDRRAVLILHDLDECAVPEISAALGIPLGTAYSRLRAARSDFARAVRRLKAQRGKP